MELYESCTLGFAVVVKQELHLLGVEVVLFEELGQGVLSGLSVQVANVNSALRTIRVVLLVFVPFLLVERVLVAAATSASTTAESSTTACETVV